MDTNGLANIPTSQSPIDPAKRGFRCVVLDTEDEFLACREEWNQLRGKCPLDDPFSEWEYVWDWWKTFGAGFARLHGQNPLFILKVYSTSNELVAMLPFVTSPLNRAFASPRVMRLFGHNGTLGPSDMSEMPLHLVLPGWEAEVTRAIMDAIKVRLEKRTCDAVLVRLSYDHSLELFNQEAVALSSIASPLIKDRTGAMIASLPGSYAAYIKSLSKSMRDNTKYYPKLLERAGLKWSVRTISDPCQIIEALDEVIRLHRLRAKSASGPRHEDHISGATEAAFLHRLIQRKASTANALVAILDIEGKPAAAQVFFAQGDKISVYYSGFDPIWAKFSPITVLQATVFQEAIGRGVRKVDFFLEDAPWKARWGAVPSGPCVEAFLCSKATSSMVRASLWAGMRVFRRIGQSLEKNRRAIRGAAKRWRSRKDSAI